MTVTSGIEEQPAMVAVEPPPPRVRSAIAIFVTRFPRIDETFILREINELERLGQPVVLVPLMRDYGRVVHEEAKPWLGRALYMPLLSLVIVRSNLRRLVREPRRYLRLFGRLVAGTAFRPAVLIRTIALFPKSVYLADLLPRLGIRHMHAHFAVHPTTMAYIVHSLANVSYSFTVHGPDVFVHRLLLREKIRNARVVRAVSTFTKAFLSGLYPIETQDKIEVVHTGVNPEVYERAVLETARRKTRPHILSVAALTEVKGFHFLIDACARLVQEGIDLECTIVGDGPLRGAIRARIESQGMADRVRLTGALPQHEVARLMADCDVFVLPSVIAYSGQMDSLPISLMEAMATGKPVVASALSGIFELVRHGASGILVDATHPERIASAIRNLIENPELSERMGKAGQEKVRSEFDVRQVATQIVRLLEPHMGVRGSVAQSIASLNWQHLRTCALGIRRVRERAESFIAELTITDGISKRDVVLKQQRPHGGDLETSRRQAQAEFDVLTRLRAAMAEPEETREGVTYSTPRVLVYDAEHAAIVMERAVGRPLDGLIRKVRIRGTAGKLVIPMRRAGNWLRRMQAATRTDADGREILAATMADAERDLDIASITQPALRRRRERILQALLDLESKVAQTPLFAVGSHGDYRPNNIFIGQQRVDVIDFEAYREGLALADVAWFLIHLQLGFAFPVIRRGVHRLEQSFLEAYAGPAQLDRDTLRFFKVVSALKLLARTADDAGLKAFLRRRALRKIVIAATGSEVAVEPHTAEQ